VTIAIELYIGFLDFHQARIQAPEAAATSANSNTTRRLIVPIPDPKQIEQIQLTPSDQQTIAQSVEKIREVLQGKNVDIEDVLGFIGVQQLQETKKNVMIRFAEDSVSQMNMVAFD
jgi:hypothetical protein